MGISGLGRADPQHAPSNQPWRQIATLPRALARTKTITAGFVIGAQPPAATVPLAAPDALSFKTRRNPALHDLHDRPGLSIDQPASRDRDPLAVTDLLPAGAPPCASPALTSTPGCPRARRSTTMRPAPPPPPPAWATAARGPGSGWPGRPQRPPSPAWHRGWPGARWDRPAGGSAPGPAGGPGQPGTPVAAAGPRG